jgi:hypothetical protein
VQDIGLKAERRNETTKHRTVHLKVGSTMQFSCYYIVFCNENLLYEVGFVWQ